jgi:hypothetical protein
MRARYRFGLILLIAALVALACAAVANAAYKPELASGIIRATSIESEGSTASPDAYEAGIGDDTTTTAQDLTLHIRRNTEGDLMFGEAPYAQAHTIDVVTTDTVDCDWYKFTVTADDSANRAFNVMIDVWSQEHRDLMIELYGPAPFSPSAPGENPAWDRNYPGTGCFDGADDEGWVSPSAQLTFNPFSKGKPAGTYYFRVRPFTYQQGALNLHVQTAGAYTVRFKAGQTTRLAGVSREDTAIKIMREGWHSKNAKDIGGTANAVLTSSLNFPDALSGASLAGVLGSGGAPMLLARPGLTAAPDALIAELQDKGVENVYLLGDVWTAGFKADLSSHGFNWIPVAGTNRVRTAVEVAKTARLFRPLAKVGIVVNGWNFPDALASTPLSYARRTPILLTHTSSLDTDTAQAVTDLGLTDIVIVGGPKSVSGSVEASLVAQLGGAQHVLRIAGLDRYDTAVRFAWWTADLEGPGARLDGKIGTDATTTVAAMRYDRVGVATGEKFPDALAAGPFCGKAQAPLLLSRSTFLPPVVNGADGELEPGLHQYFNGNLIGRSYIFGGEGTLSKGVLLEVDQMTGFQGF